MEKKSNKKTKIVLMKCRIITFFLAIMSCPVVCLAGVADIEKNIAKIFKYDVNAGCVVLGMMLMGFVCFYNSTHNFLAVTSGMKRGICLLLIVLGGFCFFRGIQGYDSLVAQITEYETISVGTKSTTDEQEKVIFNFMNAFINQDTDTCIKYSMPSAKGDNYKVMSTMSESVMTIIRYNGFTIDQGSKVTYELCDIREHFQGKMLFSYVLYVNNSSAGICRDVVLINTDKGWKVDIDSFATSQLAMMPI